MNQRQGHPPPRAREEGLIVEPLGDELLVYDERTHKSHCLNRAAALVWKGCDGRSTAGEIARRVGAELNAEVEESLVWMALEDLGKRGLLTAKAARPAAFGRISRRDLIRRAGAAAVLIPVIATITAPTAYAAVSCAGSCNPQAQDCPAGCFCSGSGTSGTCVPA